MNDDRDPRIWALAHPVMMLLLFVGLTLLMVWGNVRLHRRGMFSGDVILRSDDPYRAMDRYVHDQKTHEGFAGEETIAFFLNGEMRSGADLERVWRFTEAVKNHFGTSVLSLAEIPSYHDTGDALADDPYITKEQIDHADFRMGEWKQKVARDPGVHGVFVGRTFAWASVVRYLPPQHDEIVEFRETVEFLEGRSIPWWEWYIKRDISPREPGVGVGGWVIGRGMLDQGLNVDMLTLVFCGVLLTFPVFWWALGNWQHAMLAVGVMIAGGFVWTRGWMGICSIPERVFSVLVYANVLVQGTSFALHKFAAFRASEASDPVLAWRSATHVDQVIGTTAGIAIFGFLTLYTFAVAPIRELGLASAFGVGWLWILAVFFLPAFDVLCGDRRKSGEARQFPSPARELTTLTKRVMARCLDLMTWLTAGARAWLVLGVVCAVFGIVVGLFATGHIESRTRALEFLRGTSVEQQARVLNEPGNLGFEFLDLLVEPAGAGDLYDPQFLQRAWAYHAALRKVPDAREVASILPSLHRIAQESFKKEFPDTREEIDAGFVLIESRLSPAVQRQLYFPYGVRIAVSYGFDDSVRLGRFCENALALARDQFPDLRVSAFNTVPLYPRVDLYVREGKIANVFSSQLGVALLCAVLIAWRNRGRTGRRLSPMRSGLVMSTPLFFATGVIGLVMWQLNVALDIATASIGALAINAATDFSLYTAWAYQDALRQQSPNAALADTVKREGTLVMTDCLLNVVCFLPLVTSHFVPIAAIGWMMAVMLIACAVGTLFVMATLLPRCVVLREMRA